MTRIGVANRIRCESAIELLERRCQMVGEFEGCHICVSPVDIYLFQYTNPLSKHVFNVLNNICFSFQPINITY